MVNYYFNKKNYHESVTKNEISIDDILKHYEYLLSCDNYPRDLKVLINTLHTEFSFQPSKVSEYRIELKAVIEKLMKKYNVIHEVIVVDKPSMAAIAAFFEHNFSDMKNYSFKVFSTEKSARNWIELISN